MKITDQQQRDLALDPTQSFIVQAPAGSGKTELLTQRFLKLLSLAEKAPEEIIAITFTRKAAYEMRRRIMDALKKASSQPKPKEAYAQKTWQLAKAVLQRDKTLDWQLLHNPTRFRIQTIDALCATLTKQMPILSRFGAQPNISKDPSLLYKKAARALIQQLNETSQWSDSIKHLLLHLDNRLTTIEGLIINMLKKRDQWLSHIASAHSEKALRIVLENGLRGITEDCLLQLEEAFPQQHKNELLTLLQFSNKNLSNNSIDKLPHYTIESKPDWLVIANLLLTNDNQWRKSVTKNIGFPAASNTTNKEEKTLFKSMKERMLNLLAVLHSFPNFQEALSELKKTPDIAYTDAQWKTLTALLDFLPLAAAQLTLVFQAAGEVDFIEISQAALQALGNEEIPTDLALSLDYQIHHLLIDEFQDTSTTQYRLVEKLTAGWTNGDGHTLFIVGDPMQSIYRFREAEVGLFLRAKQEGIGQIKLIPITLSTNFRSTTTIVNWVNDHFKEIFPTHEHISNGAVTYTSATAIHKAQESGVKIDPLIDADRTMEAKRLTQLVQHHQHEFPNETIAILVRARRHLAEILPTLRANNIPYQAIEIDGLGFQLIIQDLFSLTKALLHPADRTAWLSILRAPWCGLLLDDLYIIATSLPDETILHTIQQDIISTQLTKGGQQRLNHLKQAILPAIQQRRRMPLRQWVRTCWIALKGPACLHSETDIENANVFFELLEDLSVGKDIADFFKLEEKLYELFAKPDTKNHHPLQVMTIHKAKGLEFDTVILPGLHHLTPHAESQLLLWQERPRPHHDSDLILAPIKPSQENLDSIYQYIFQENNKKNTLEDARLFYVAVTRAKKHLHLLGTAFSTDDGAAVKTPVSSSFLKMIWPFVKKDFFIPATQHFRINVKNIKTPKENVEGILRLKAASLKSGTTTTKQTDNPFELKTESSFDSIVGTIIHHILEQIAIGGLETWSEKFVYACEENWKQLLLQNGIQPKELDKAIEKVALAIHNILSDKKGQWILQSHVEATSELALTFQENGKIQHVIIDRTFIDEKGNRWIIDYKTTAHPDPSLKEKYQQQVKTYGKAMQALSNEPLRFGIYFPMIPAWIEI